MNNSGPVGVKSPKISISHAIEGFLPFGTDQFRNPQYM